MNSVLASIYGTGMDKTASEEAVTLDDISAADFLAAVESGDIDLDQVLPESEKTVGDEFDLSGVSEEELLAYLQQAEENTIEKMASSGEFDYWDTAGRIMAHSMVQESEKIASGEDIDLNDLSVDEFIAIADELRGDSEKTAGEEELDLNQLSADEFVALADVLREDMEKEAGIKDILRAVRAKAGKAGKWAKRPHTTYKQSTRASARQREAGHESARGPWSARMKGARTAASKHKAQAAMAAGGVAAPPAVLAALIARKRAQSRR